VAFDDHAQCDRLGAEFALPDYWKTIRAGPAALCFLQIENEFQTHVAMFFTIPTFFEESHLMRCTMRCVILPAIALFSAAVVLADEPKLNVLSPEEAKDGFVLLFDGKTLDGWQGAVKGYKIQDGAMVCDPGGNLYTKKEYANFILRFEFKVPPGGNNGVGIRTPMNVDAAYHGMEIQILDTEHPKYKDLQPYQVHGSIYGVVPAKRGFLKPAGEWNQQEIVADGPHIKVTLNGTVITEADLSKIDKTIDHHDHPGLHNAKGYIGWLGHGDPVAFRNVRIKELP